MTDLALSPDNPPTADRPDPRAARRSRDRRTLVLLALITLLGLVLRLWFVTDVNRSKPDDVTRMVGDEGGYDMFATEMLDGHFFRYPFRTPTYPMFLAAVYFTFGHSPAAAIVVQAFLGTASIVLTYWLGRYVTSRGGALIGAAVIAVQYELIDITTKLYSETVYTFLLLLCAIGFYRALRRPTVGRWTIAGVTLGVLNLCRPTGGLLPIALAIALPWRWTIAKRLRAIVIYGLAMLIPIIPWTIHNYREYHVFMPFCVSVATLWQGSPEFYHEIESGKSLLDIWKGGTLDPATNGGYSPHTIDGDRYFHDRAVASIKREPGLYARYCVEKMFFTWAGSPAIDWPWIYAEYYTRGQTIGLLTCRLFALFGFISIPLLAWRKKLRRFLPLLMIMAYFTFVHGVLYTEVRYSDPLHPFLGLMIGAALVNLLPHRAKQAAR